jgi:hypothetical protein
MSTRPKKAAQVGPQNPELAAQANRTIKHAGTDSTSGMCQKAVRETIQHEYGDIYDAYHKGRAEASRRAWIRGGFAVDPEHGSVVGDILYKAPTRNVPAGHVGIRVAGNKVAENSSTSVGRVRGAYGFRTLEEFGAIKTIVRLPRAKK